MDTIFWLVVAYFIGRRWLRKHPAKATILKEMLAEFQNHKRPDMMKKLVQKPQPPKAPAPTTASNSTLHAAPAPHTPASQRKKPEKQFQEM